MKTFFFLNLTVWTTYNISVNVTEENISRLPEQKSQFSKQNSQIAS
jgi:hypothetical protein